jgi:mannose-6-phosphate isomerase-like protein (cupin superfamily)
MTRTSRDAAAPAVLKHLANCPGYRISPGDTNYFALLFDTQGENCNFIAVVEIFEPGGSTPPNSHRQAHEVFFVIKGEGIATSDGVSQPLRQGDALLVRPGTQHAVRNTGEGKLYCLTVMAPDEEFGALIRSGVPHTLDEEDYRVLTGI